MAEPLKLESHKLLYDLCKHLTTLSTASALIVIAMVERLFEHPQGVGYVLTSLSCFLLTLLSGLIAMAMIGMNAGKTIDEGTFPVADANIFASAGVFAIACYFLGVLSTVAFAFKNFDIPWPA